MARVSPCRARANRDSDLQSTVRDFAAVFELHADLGVMLPLELPQLAFDRYLVAGHRQRNAGGNGALGFLPIRDMALQSPTSAATAAAFD